MLQMEAEDLDGVDALAAHARGPEIFLADRFTEEPHPLSTPTRIIRYAEEYRPDVYGHMSVLGTRGSPAVISRTSSSRMV
jgi:hypothetical protein